ncbi:hypothetical protein ZIOFF_062324 [Zingiber officinale]|uniref:Uncharacterized protein n=1 Tax=Zingiber officinale TaxID=94328 RepID=A0A8J5F9J4_ZINOF|nr:hypothetical protein ZIOFF_062324 [Zingiber officinale]
MSSSLLLLSLFFPSSLSAVVTTQSSASPSNSSTIYDILQEYNLPPGILPDTVKSFSVASNGYFVIDLYGECYVYFEYIVYYAPRVSCFLGYGSVSNLEGVQIRSYLIWYGVSYNKRAKKVVRLAFEALESEGNYLRIQDDTLTGAVASVDNSTKWNLRNLVQIGENLLEKPVSRVNLETGQSVPVVDGEGGTMSNKERLVKFAKTLSDERKLRQENLIIYVEACESGSIFEGLMPEDLNVYVTTASNAVESSWGTYCPGMDPPPPPEYMTCLGDLYNVAWMEDRFDENHNLKEETVKMRTSNQNTYSAGSHVMEYGDKNVKPEKLYLYQGFDPANANLTENALRLSKQMGVINQRDADLLFLWHMIARAT